MTASNPEMDRIAVVCVRDFKSLMAVTDFRQGEAILKLPMETLSEPDMYSIEIMPGIHVDCSDHPIGSTNHSCDPNAAVIKGVLRAWKCIKAGDEITFDYKRTENKLAAPFDCLCGAKTCRGRIE